MRLPVPTTWSPGYDKTRLPIQMYRELGMLYQSDIYNRIKEIHQEIYILRKDHNDQYHELHQYSDTIHYLLNGGGTNESYNLALKLRTEYDIQLDDGDLDVIKDDGIGYSARTGGTCFFTNTIGRQYLKLVLVIREKYFRRRLGSILNH